MIRDNQRYFNRLHVLIDACLITAAFFSAWFIRFISGLVPMLDGAVVETGKYFSLLFYIVPLFVILNYFCKLYTSKRVSGRKIEFYNIVKANIIGIVIVIGVLYMLNSMHYSRTTFGLFCILSIIYQTIARNVIRSFLRSIRKKGYNIKYILLVGYSNAAKEYINRIAANPQWGYVICGILDDQVQAGTIYKGVKVLGRIENLEVILPANKLDEIAITLPLENYGELEKIVMACEKSGVHTQFVPDYNRVIPSKPYTEDLMGLPIINIRNVPLTNTFNRVIKRTIDIVGSTVGIIVTSPIMLVSAIIIKATSPGPVIFCQERIGLHNRIFKMYKFRSMVEQKPEEEAKAWTTKDDPRVTKFGKFMRHTSLDEFPQLFNILRGDMSMVGPRPERPLFVEKYREEIPRYMVKHQIRPGLTGWAQINGYRGDTSIEKRIEFDLYYIENWTLGFDIKILFLTIFKGFINKNAY